MKPIRLDVMPTGLREILAVHADDVRGVIEAAAMHEGRTYPVDVDGHAERLEALDLPCVEAARGDDAHVPVARLVERGAQQLDEARRDAPVDRDESVRNRAQPPRAPPLTLLVGGHCDRTADVGRVAGPGLRLMALVARAEHDHRLAIGGGYDLAGVRRDAGALGQRAE